jgi:molybdate transport system regulatory protein
MIPRYNLWIEENEEVVLSLWRVNLLTTIDETGSISAAAEKMKVPYRRAWEKIREMEQRLGFRLLDTEVGGSGGGGANLTQKAREYVDRFKKFEKGLDVEVQSRFEEAFGSIVRE